MKVRINNANRHEIQPIFALLLVVVALFVGCSRHREKTEGAATQSTFTIPDEAGEALQTASRANDESALARILGPESKAILSSGDSAEDKAALASFVSKFDRMNRWVTMTDGSRVLYIGADNYPFPIPLAQNSASRWYFNTAAGKDEILARRIGKNEILAIDAISAMADSKHFDSRAVGQSGALPILDGYSFRVLTAQKAAVGAGVKKDIAARKMREHVTILASPVSYGDSGIMTFILGRDGIVYQKDLGSDTAAAAASIQEFNPQYGWSPAE